MTATRQDILTSCHPPILKYCLHDRCESCYGLSMIIAVCNPKGGVGKSTIAVHLAAWLHRRGRSVVLADCDQQRSSSDWVREAAPGVRTVWLHNSDLILNELPVLAKEAEYVIADGPGSHKESSRALMLRADFAIVPAKASMLEVRALAQATEVLQQARSVRNEQPRAVVVLSMVGQNYRLTRDMKEAAEALHLPLASRAMILRQIYADSPGQGAVVWNMGARAKDAALEVDLLFEELLPEAARAVPVAAGDDAK